MQSGRPSRTVTGATATVVVRESAARRKGGDDDPLPWPVGTPAETMRQEGSIFEPLDGEVRKHDVPSRLGGGSNSAKGSQEAGSRHRKLRVERHGMGLRRREIGILGTLRIDVYLPGEANFIRSIRQGSQRIFSSGKIRSAARDGPCRRCKYRTCSVAGIRRYVQGGCGTP